MIALYMYMYCHNIMISQSVLHTAFYFHSSVCSKQNITFSNSLNVHVWCQFQIILNVLQSHPVINSRQFNMSKNTELQNTIKQRSCNHTIIIVVLKCSVLICETVVSVVILSPWALYTTLENTKCLNILIISLTNLKASTHPERTEFIIVTGRGVKRK